MSITRLSYTLTVERGERAPGDGGGGRQTPAVYSSLLQSSLSRRTHECFVTWFLWSCVLRVQICACLLHDRDQPQIPNCETSTWTFKLCHWVLFSMVHLAGMVLGDQVAGTLDGRPLEQLKPESTESTWNQTPKEIPRAKGNFISRHNP